MSMEELRSTELLDKEIQEDARKKSEKVLREAQLECDNILNQVTERLEKAVAEKKDKYSEKLQLVEKNLTAALPLEKERFLISFIQSSLDTKINEYLEALDEKQFVDLMLNQLKKYETIIKDKKFFVYVYGVSQKETESFISKKVQIVSVESTEFNKIVVENDWGIKNKRGILLEADDKSVRIRLTLSEIVTHLQDDYRVELYDALFGGRLEK